MHFIRQNNRKLVNSQVRNVLFGLEATRKSYMIREIYMYSFTRNLFDDGIDPVATMMKAKTNPIEVAGIVFRREPYMGQIPAAKGLLLSLLRSSFLNGEMLIQLEGERGKKEDVKLGSISNKRTVSVY
ncbi:hypothetical protein ABU162_28060 [Paenibacillus thiaminolyticus]|uniref:hypothetical protein n=1 Tax=Paenibacillus thiaminolyticus TaxID=49283 RepID=UPI0035A70F15